MIRILFSIVLAQFFCTSMWFATNAVLPDLIEQHNLTPEFLAYLTSAVQIGFIVGTLLFALLTIADKFSPSRVFFVSALVAAVFNFCGSLDQATPISLLLLRFLTGFFLAGIYPVGMKIASDYYQKGLGKSLGFLVGALVVGTALPHLIRSIGEAFPWKYVLYSTSLLSILGGIIILLFVPDGPFRKPIQKIHFSAFLDGFRNKNFSAAALGYFGHMWEVYAFWAFAPIMLTKYATMYPMEQFNIPVISFFVIASGGLACIIGGVLSQRFGPKRIAMLALALSGLCCLISPLLFLQANSLLFIAFLFFWGMVVAADSPLFSSLVALYAPEESRGTSITIVTCIGFGITIVSIQLISELLSRGSSIYLYMLLAFGPILGLVAFTKK